MALSSAMTPLKTPTEVAAEQKACALAWEESRLRNGIDRMKLIYKAFPHAVNGGSARGGLRLLYLSEYNAFGICDEGGFLTLLGDEDNANAERTLHQLFHLLSLESQDPGAVRELITGVARKRSLGTPQVPKIPKKKFSLEDLGL